MKLYLVQHAKAVPKDVDPQRPLSDEGRRDIKKVAAFIGTLNLEVDFVWHSKKIRAAQTAEVLSKVILVRMEKIERDGLSPNDNVAAIRDELVASEYDVMIVGHMPFVSKLASLLLTSDESAGTVAFQQGGILSLEQSTEGQWQVNWMVIPAILT